MDKLWRRSIVFTLLKSYDANYYFDNAIGCWKSGDFHQGGKKFWIFSNLRYSINNQFEFH